MSIKRIMFGLTLICSLIGFPTQLIAQPAEIQVQTIPELITFYAELYDVSSITLNKVIKCESQYNSMAHNSIGENSWGLVQINLNAHKSITVEQATNPNFAIDFLAKNIASGRGSMWSCYRKL